MSSRIKGAFDLSMRGVPGFFVGRLTLLSESGHSVTAFGVFAGPFGFIMTPLKFSRISPAP